MVIQVVDNIDLFLDYFGKNSVFDSEQASHSIVAFFYSCVNAHP